MYKIRVRILQLRNTECVDNSKKKIARNIAGLMQRGIQLIVLQELHNLLYFYQVGDVNNFGSVEPIPGPFAEFFGKLVRRLRVVIITLLSKKRAPGLYHGTAVVIEKDGAIAGKYRKMYIPDDPAYYEKFYFTPDDLGFHLIDTSIGRLDVLVCWDRWYPETARLVALQGVQLLVYPTAVGYESSDDKDEQQQQHNARMTVQRRRAVVNGIPVVIVDRVGHEDDPSG